MKTVKNKEPHTIFNNSLELYCLCLDLVEQAKTFYEQNPKRCGNSSVRERIEFFLENDLTPAFENAIDETFESEEDENND